MSESVFELPVNRRLAGTAIVIRKIERAKNSNEPIIVVTFEFPSRSLGKRTQLRLQLDIKKKHFLEQSKNPDVNRRIQAYAPAICRIVAKYFSKNLSS